MRASACPPTTMNSTPGAASSAQKRSSGLSSRSSNGLHAQRRAAGAFGATRALRRGHAHVGADQREIHAVVVILPRRAERLGAIARGLGHRRHSTEADSEALAD